MEIGNSRRVKDQHGHYTNSIGESSAKIQPAMHPIAPFEELRPAVSWLFEKHYGPSGRVADMSDAQTRTSGARDQKSNTVRLSRRSAVKRANSREKRNLPKRRNSKMTSNHSPVAASYHTLAGRSTPDRPPTLRRFSFDTISDLRLFDLADVEAAMDRSSDARSELDHVSDTTLPKARDTASPSSEPWNDGQTVTDTLQMCLSNNDQRLDAARQERSWEKSGNRKVTPGRRNIPATFDEMLGRKRIPTALLQATWTNRM